MIRAIRSVLVCAGLGLACVSNGLAPGATAQTRREPDVPYAPTPRTVVAEMLKLANVSADDVVYDLGSGDGRIVIMAAQTFGARGVGVEIDRSLVDKARTNARAAGVSDRVRFLRQDLFRTSLREATVVTLFLYPDVNLKLRPKLLRELAPGTRVVSHAFDMGDWVPTKTSTINGSKIFLWIVPKRERPLPRQKT
jgi:SAM-dependent methyltransferase